jgi:1,2-dihydroxy-3-keto-5-methylthiopentene dioxygenase
MSSLRIFREEDGSQPIGEFHTAEEIAQQLWKLGVSFERWPLAEVSASADEAAVLATYDKALAAQKALEGYRAADVISLNPDHPAKKELRQKFLDEHTHSEDEVRFFVRGSGLFSLHIDSNVYLLLCTAGDLIQVPANTKHWFDMGPEPEFTCIRLFTNPEGWVGHLTGDDIADRFPLFGAK